MNSKNQLELAAQAQEHIVMIQQLLHSALKLDAPRFGFGTADETK